MSSFDKLRMTACSCHPELAKGHLVKVDVEKRKQNIVHPRHPSINLPAGRQAQDDTEGSVSMKKLRGFVHRYIDFPFLKKELQYSEYRPKFSKFRVVGYSL